MTSGNGNGNGNGFRELCGRHILVVEDCSSTRGLIARLLSREGAHVSVCDSGNSAVSIVTSSRESESPIDVVLMDMDMPVLDGPAATRMLRANGFDRPIIAVTDGSAGSQRPAIMADGCDEYTTKPIDTQELIGLIHTCMDRAAPRK